MWNRKSNTNRLTDKENKLVVTKREREGERKKIKGLGLTYTNYYTMQIQVTIYKDILYNTGNYSYYVVITLKL